VPFLDHKVVEFAMGLPLSQILRRGVHKWVLKKAALGRVPQGLIERQKQGFRAPIDEWHHGAFRDYARQELRSFCTRTEYLNSTEVDKLVDSSRGQRVWYLLNAALWWKQYIASGQDAVPQVAQKTPPKVDVPRVVERSAAVPTVA
jgi:asparagine synthase (glutamine-hydrolysing)